MPALRPVTDGRGQPCPQCELESHCRAIRVVPSLCGMSGEMVRCVLAEVRSSLGTCRAGSESLVEGVGVLAVLIVCELWWSFLMMSECCSKEMHHR